MREVERGKVLNQRGKRTEGSRALVDCFTCSSFINAYAIRLNLPMTEERRTP